MELGHEWTVDRDLVDVGRLEAVILSVTIAKRSAMNSDVKSYQSGRGGDEEGHSERGGVEARGNGNDLEEGEREDEKKHKRGARGMECLICV